MDFNAWSTAQVNFISKHERERERERERETDRQTDTDTDTDSETLISYSLWLKIAL